MWKHWVNGILGVLIVIFSWAYMAASTGRTLMIIAGILVAILGFWGGSVTTDTRYTGTRGAA